MDFIKKNVSFSLFRVVGNFPLSQERLEQGLAQNCFMDLKDKSELDNESYGWVHIDNCLEPPKLSIQHLEPYVCLCLRVDKRKISKALMMAKIAQKQKERLAETGHKKISKPERLMIRGEVQKELASKAPISSMLFRGIWNYKTQTCFLFSGSSSAQKVFMRVFAQSFGVTLELQDPTTLAAIWAKSNSAMSILKAVEPSSLAPTTATSEKE